VGELGARFALFAHFSRGRGRHRARRTSVRSWLIVLVAVGLLAAPGASLAEPPPHSNAGGNSRAENSSEESTPAPEETAPADEGSSGSGSEEAPSPDQGSEHGSGGAGGGATADQDTPGGDPSSEEGAVEETSGDAGKSKKHKSSARQAEDRTIPPGNNGTVKVDGRDFDTLPNNEPHPGCDFQIDFYGYDEGDLTADIFFTLQAPSGSGPLASRTDIFIGEDPAGGGTDLDAEEYFDLSAALAASGAFQHPIQGYHIKLTVHAEGSIGADVKHKVFWVKCEEQGGQFSELIVTKVWLDEEGNEVPPPEDLSPSFRIIITNPDNGTSLTCRVEDDGDLDCSGDLVVEDGDELTVEEINAPEGWTGPDSAVAECVTTQEGNDTVTTCEIEIVNAFTGGGGLIVTNEVEKVWLDEEGNPTSPPDDLPEGFQIIITGEDGSLTCTVDQGTGEAGCEGDLVVEDGEEVSVEEVNAPEGWLGPDEATAECRPESETHTVCTIEIVNIPQVLGRQFGILKIWVRDGKESSVPPANLPPGFTLIITDPGEGTITCTYQGTTLACDVPEGLVIEDGEELIVDEENAPSGWDGPETVVAECDEGFCTVTVRNEFQGGGGRPPVVLPRGPITPPLAVTGIEAQALMALAMILLGSGAAVLAVERRRRRAAG
jgi:hypothetical protein